MCYMGVTDLKSGKCYVWLVRRLVGGGPRHREWFDPGKQVFLGGLKMFSINCTIFD